MWLNTREKAYASLSTKVVRASTEYSFQGWINNFGLQEGGIPFSWNVNRHFHYLAKQTNVFPFSLIAYLLMKYGILIGRMEHMANPVIYAIDCCQQMELSYMNIE